MIRDVDADTPHIAHHGTFSPDFKGEAWIEGRAARIHRLAQASLRYRALSTTYLGTMLVAGKRELSSPRDSAGAKKNNFSVPP